MEENQGDAHTTKEDENQGRRNAGNEWIDEAHIATGGGSKEKRRVSRRGDELEEVRERVGREEEKGFKKRGKIVPVQGHWHCKPT